MIYVPFDQHLVTAFGLKET